MDFFRAYAYAVTPQRTVEEGERLAPQGGPIKVTAEIRDALILAMQKSKLKQQCLVNFDVDTKTRTNEVRDFVLQTAFGNGPSPATAALNLAVRLAAAMDGRSPGALLVIAVAKPADGTTVRQITLWAFPREEAFQFNAAGKGGPQMKFLKDIFSQSSSLRKAALFEGQQIKTDFLSGRVLDFQTTGSAGRGADYWVRDFLNCQMGITPELGTKTLAAALRKAFDQSDDLDVREQISQGTMAIRASKKQTWSIESFADEYLDDKAKEAVLKSAPNAESRRSSFKLDKAVFDKAVGLRVFKLEGDVIVSAPFDTLGSQVKIVEGEKRTLTCEGTIIEEKLKAKKPA